MIWKYKIVPIGHCGHLSDRGDRDFCGGERREHVQMTYAKILKFWPPSPCPYCISRPLFSLSERTVSHLLNDHQNSLLSSGKKDQDDYIELKCEYSLGHLRILQLFKVLSATEWKTMIKQFLRRFLLIHHPPSAHTLSACVGTRSPCGCGSH